MSIPLAIIIGAAAIAIALVSYAFFEKKQGHTSNASDMFGWAVIAVIAGAIVSILTFVDEKKEAEKAHKCPTQVESKQ